MTVSVLSPPGKNLPIPFSVIPWEQFQPVKAMPGVSWFRAYIRDLPIFISGIRCVLLPVNIRNFKWKVFMLPESQSWLYWSIKMAPKRKTDKEASSSQGELPVPICQPLEAISFFHFLMWESARGNCGVSLGGSRADAQPGLLFILKDIMLIAWILIWGSIMTLSWNSYIGGERDASQMAFKTWMQILGDI